MALTVLMTGPVPQAWAKSAPQARPPRFGEEPKPPGNGGDNNDDRERERQERDRREREEREERDRRERSEQEERNRREQQERERHRQEEARREREQREEQSRREQQERERHRQEEARRERERQQEAERERDRREAIERERHRQEEARREREQQERAEREREDRERRERDRWEREQDRREREEAERRERERWEREEQARRERERWEREERERRERENQPPYIPPPVIVEPTPPVVEPDPHPTPDHYFCDDFYGDSCAIFSFWWAKPHREVEYILSRPLETHEAQYMKLMSVFAEGRRGRTGTVGITSLKVMLSTGKLVDILPAAKKQYPLRVAKNGQVFLAQEGELLDIKLPSILAGTQVVGYRIKADSWIDKDTPAYLQVWLGDVLTPVEEEETVLP